MSKDTTNQNNLFYQRASLEGVKDILKECWKQYDQDHNVAWLEMANTMICPIEQVTLEHLCSTFQYEYFPWCLSRF